MTTLLLCCSIPLVFAGGYALGMMRGSEIAREVFSKSTRDRNDEIDRAIADIHAIRQAERAKAPRAPRIVDTVLVEEHPR